MASPGISGGAILAFFRAVKTCDKQTEMRSLPHV